MYIQARYTEDALSGGGLLPITFLESCCRADVKLDKAVTSRYARSNGQILGQKFRNWGFPWDTVPKGR